MSELVKRILTAIVLASVMIFFVFKTPVDWFFGYLVVIVLLSLFELLRLANVSTLNKILSIAGVIMFSTNMAFGLPTGHPFAVIMLPIACIWWLLNIYKVISYPNNKPTNFLLPINAVLLLTPIFGLWWLHFNDQKPLLLLLFLIVWGADSFAYFSGKTFGKHKLAPSLSGGKTIEGVIGGLIGVLLITGAWMSITSYPDWKILVLALVTGIFSVAGDLYESIYKREANVKDSGSLLPGHGGVLDRIDGLLAATPIFVTGIFFLQ
ncbi:phosphatidate cytidylyltransferase [Bathymodiolus septemdierum thioautotrophic gill symbiont]|uniref:Phosphatidate cytidylyltransferase n=1 Tax=endosymbiont of Bathymodiolus septemdierum str. Myojin knoll TaxID=1303921 RepID=A0A0N7KB54_9GAMM|nr:phosphatidate cytidylyltransferase [Bathymodiolus septemdierum thioautotrophic gill symbiont]BAS67063.1 phosphatidate cytidylyltransferase [endosymbiont of Bathymodiolus septemdierum str. Myojin knoll]